MKFLSFLYGPQELGQTFLRYFPPMINSKKIVSIKKIFNAMRAEYERRIKKINLTSHPFILHIELTNVCNLKCPYCLAGNGTDLRQKGYLNFEDYKKLIDDLKDYLIIVRLDGLGESLLNNSFIKMVEYAHQNKIFTAVSSNLITISKDDMDKLIDAGLDYLIIGLDGATEEVYQSVRPGGKLETVIENIKYLVNIKKTRKSKTPYIETQFITFEENFQESKQVKNLSISLEANRHLIKDLRELPTNVAKYKSGKTKSCYWLWYVLNVTWQGDLKACCLAGLSSDFSFGNILNNNISDEWNNNRMQSIRKLFIAKDTKLMNEMNGCICLDCYKLIL
ncbi:MAG: radical SAM protein [FCB group bacterium]